MGYDGNRNHRLGRASAPRRGGPAGRAGQTRAGRQGVALERPGRADTQRDRTVRRPLPPLERGRRDFWPAGHHPARDRGRPDAVAGRPGVHRKEGAGPRAGHRRRQRQYQAGPAQARGQTETALSQPGGGMVSYGADTRRRVPSRASVAERLEDLASRSSTAPGPALAERRGIGPAAQPGRQAFRLPARRGGQPGGPAGAAVGLGRSVARRAASCCPPSHRHRRGGAARPWTAPDAA